MLVQCCYLDFHSDSSSHTISGVERHYFGIIHIYMVIKAKVGKLPQKEIKMRYSQKTNCPMMLHRSQPHEKVTATRHKIYPEWRKIKRKLYLEVETGQSFGIPVTCKVRRRDLPVDLPMGTSWLSFYDLFQGQGELWKAAMKNSGRLEKRRGKLQVQVGRGGRSWRKTVS